MSFYLLLKVLHLLGVVLFAGISFANGYAALSAVRSGELPRITFAFDLVGRQNQLFLIPSALLLPVTGIWMALLSGTPLSSGWLAEILALFGLLAVLLVVAIPLESELRRMAVAAEATGELPAGFSRLMRWWNLLGSAASLGIIAMIVMMTARLSILSGGPG